MKTGKISESILKGSVFRQIKTKRTEVRNGAGVGVDCAIFAVPGEGHKAMCMQEAAVAGKTDMGILLERCVNSLATAHAEPIAVMLSIVMPERAEREQLRDLMQEAERICSLRNMQIAGGHTRVSALVEETLVSAVVYGCVRGEGVKGGESEGGLGCRAARAGDEIVMSKWIGLEGTARLAAEREKELRARFPSHLVETAAGFLEHISVLPEAGIAAEWGVSAMHDISEGGIFAALWELAEGAGLGLCADLYAIPVRQETVEICELLQRNPYELAGGGSLLMTTPHGAGLVRKLEEAGIPAAVIGCLTRGRDRIIKGPEENRYLGRP